MGMTGDVHRGVCINVVGYMRAACCVTLHRILSAILRETSLAPVTAGCIAIQCFSGPAQPSILQSRPAVVLQFELPSAPKRYRSASRNPRIDTPLRYGMHNWQVQVWASALDVASLCGPLPSTSSLPICSYSTAIMRNPFHASYPAIVGISSLQDRVALRVNSIRQIPPFRGGLQNSPIAACR
jgi:hypothetical protein